MSVDGRFIYYLAKELNDNLKNARIQKISQLSKADFLFFLNQKSNLYLSLSTSLARLHLSDSTYSNFVNPGGFCMFLRKYIEKGVIQEIKSINFDRIIEIKINNRNDIGDLSDYYLMIELFGRYANLIILDGNKTILNAFKHIHPFDNIDRIIVNGSKYTLPEDEKIAPDNLEKIENFFNQPEISYKDIIMNIRGFSPLIANYLIKTANYNPNNMYKIYLDILNQEILPTKTKDKFYYLDIFDEPDKQHFPSLSNLLETQFHESSSLDRVRQIHRYLANFIKNNLEKNINKLEKLSKDLLKAKNNQINRIKGDLLIQNQHLINSTQNEINLFSYELNQELKVEIDRQLSIIENANRYFTKYKKQKNAIKYIAKQINLTKKEITYFEELSLQINDNHDLKDLEEIQEELIDNHYLHKRKSKSKIKNPNYDIYYDELGIKILVGKNNIQNNYITHKISRKDYLWFHVQNQSGSHTVVCSTEDLQESTIRAAANLAALHSKSKNSSSVPVDYTKIKNIKKIPGEIGSYVSYTNQKTIYIDPDESELKKLRKG